jgi:hypothetical protein
VKLECHSCYEEYMLETSTAALKGMYCSSECEIAEDTRLKEANEIISNAEKENPEIFLPVSTAPVMKNLLKLFSHQKEEDKEDV